MPGIILINNVSFALYQFVDGQVSIMNVNINIYSLLIKKFVDPFSSYFFMSLRDMIILFGNIFALNNPMCLFTNGNDAGVFCIFSPSVSSIRHNCYAVIFFTSYFTPKGQFDALFIFLFNVRVDFL